MPNHFAHASVLALSLLASGALAQEAVLFAPIPETADLTPTVADAIARIRSEPLTADVRIVELDSAAFGSEIMTFDTGLEKFGAMTFNSPDLQALDGGAIPDDFRDFSWAGRTVADDAESIIYVDPDGSVSGTVFSDDGSYEIRPVAGGLHAIIEIDDGAIPPEHPEGQLPFEEGGLAPDPVPDSDAAAVDTVDILIAFTTEAAARYPNVRAQANLIIASANRVYQRTGIATRVSLAEAAIVGYDESDSMRTDLSRLRKRSDGHMDGLHDLRDDTSADLVHLIVDREDFCGLAYVNASSTTAFGITNYSCAVNNLSFTHEIGHNFGACHDRSNSAGCTPTRTWGYGFQSLDKSFRTVMAYQCTGQACPRRPVHSHPEDFGEADKHDVRRLLIERAPTVARFR